MVVNFIRALPVVAALFGAAIFSPAANATSYDVNFSLTTFPGGAPFGSGMGTFENSGGFPNIFTSDDLEITITDDADTFDFTSAIATFSSGGSLKSLTGFVDGGLGGDSITLGFLGGLFVDADYCTTRDTLFQISEALVKPPGADLAAPLPATWPMMLFGLIGVGLVAYRGGKNKTQRYATA
jgi:hypothetical protein